MRLHVEEILVTFLGLTHLAVAVSSFVISRTWGMHNSGIDDGAMTQ